jgi:hypothetical protein
MNSRATKLSQVIELYHGKALSQLITKWSQNLGLGEVRINRGEPYLLNPSLISRPVGDKQIAIPLPCLTQWLTFFINQTNFSWFQAYPYLRVTIS